METVKDIIVFDKVSKIYHIGEQEVRALDEASMYIKKHEFVSIIGPSGSGKSTMMNIIGCLDTVDSGHYILNGQAIQSYSETELSHIRNRQIGFIFQNFNLIGSLTAEENIELPLIYQRLPKKERKKRVNDALKLMKLDNRGLHRPSELSGGQQQRIAIARAIASRPPLILADEPTGNLDSRTGDEIMQIFHELHDRGNTIVLITHDENVAKQASRSIRILDGRVTEVDE